MKVPFYTLNNFEEKISTHYKNQNKKGWINLEVFLTFLNKEFIKNFENIDMRSINKILSEREKENISRTHNGKIIQTYKNLLISCKLLIPTLWTSENFKRNMGKGISHGIQINLPKGTPISSFCNGKVIQKTTRKGSRKGLGNFIIIKDNDSNIWTFANLENIYVEKNQKIKKGKNLGTAGKTGGGYYPGIYIQIDKLIAGVYPYYSEDPANIKKYTQDPLQIIKNNLKIKEEKTEKTLKKAFYLAPGYPKLLPKDLNISEKKAFTAISGLYGIGAINLYKEKFNPQKPISKSQFSNIIKKLQEKGLIDPTINEEKSTRNLTKNEVKKILSGINNPSLKKYISSIDNEVLTKEQVASILWEAIKYNIPKHDVRV
ncbi:M23 family metallopeptidase [Candidatus Absconditicoccus praedator]|uniref:M23 family metallopeptidase n=1 Tax=Candidatus Absconditicoccus praedator TaxID=2735562 RepID=UPI001E5FE31C|nr:M23 family metallopeptidase [Candidatus Absconditicoccus praedator]UFX82563.1 M23 family metallopeptidase [Candidatus Absconditicoccus praedator]